MKNLKKLNEEVGAIIKMKKVKFSGRRPKQVQKKK